MTEETAAVTETEAKQPDVVAPVAAQAAPQPSAPAFKDEGCPELRAMIEERDATKEKARKKTSLVVTVALLALLGTAGGWFAVSPSAQAKVARIVPLFKESMRDVKSLANTKKNFDQQLEKIAGELRRSTGLAVESRVVAGSTVPAIQRFAVLADLLVIGAQGDHPLRDFLMGSTAQRLLRRISRPILVVRRGPKGPYRVGAKARQKRKLFLGKIHLR